MPLAVNEQENYITKDYKKMDKEYEMKLNKSFDEFLSQILVIYRKNHNERIYENKANETLLKEFLKNYADLKDAALGRRRR